LEFGWDERENLETKSGSHKKPAILVNVCSGCLSDKAKENYMQMLREADLLPYEEIKKRIAQARQRRGSTIHRMIFPWS